MALKQCKECKKEVSSSANKCPHCGVSHPTTTASDVLKGLGVLLVIVISGVLFFGGDDEPTPEDIQQAKECRADIDCIGYKKIFDAGFSCGNIIEQFAKYDVEWGSGYKFNRYLWKNKEQGIVTYSGNNVKFQNGFGAWQKKSYQCDFNVDIDRVVDVRFL